MAPANYLEVVRELGRDVPERGPWHAERGADGALVLYDLDGEPVALIYGGRSTARYLEAVAPATMFGGRLDDDPTTMGPATSSRPGS